VHELEAELVTDYYELKGRVEQNTDKLIEILGKKPILIPSREIAKQR